MILFSYKKREVVGIHDEGNLWEILVVAFAHGKVQLVAGFEACFD